MDLETVKKPFSGISPGSRSRFRVSICMVRMLMEMLMNKVILISAWLQGVTRIPVLCNIRSGSSRSVKGMISGYLRCFPSIFRFVFSPVELSSSPRILLPLESISIPGGNGGMISDGTRPRYPELPDLFDCG